MTTTPSLEDRVTLLEQLLAESLLFRCCHASWRDDEDEWHYTGDCGRDLPVFRQTRTTATSGATAGDYSTIYLSSTTSATAPAPPPDDRPRWPLHAVATLILHRRPRLPVTSYLRPRFATRVCAGSSRYRALIN